MKKPRGGQIRANRLIGPRKVLGEGDRRVPAKGRGRTAPYRGRSAASWIWSTPLDASASEGSSVRATPSLRPPRILEQSLFFTERRTAERAVSEDGYSSFFLILVWGFPIVAAGILFDVDHWRSPTPGVRDWRTHMDARSRELFEALAADLLSDWAINGSSRPSPRPSPPWPPNAWGGGIRRCAARKQSSVLQTRGTPRPTVNRQRSTRASCAAGRGRFGRRRSHRMPPRWVRSGGWR